jgi:hypothetical protein
VFEILLLLLLLICFLWLVGLVFCFVFSPLEPSFLVSWSSLAEWYSFYLKLFVGMINALKSSRV